MYDAGKIIAGLVIFVGIVTYPIWGSIGSSVNVPVPVVKTSGTCVESAEYMRANHMQMLNEWRDEVVRDNNRVYVSQQYGKEFEKSLSSAGKASCMSCHSNKAEFCDSCHNYTAVTPYCWECHLEPKEEI
ncbi:sulfate reduction electron transfer complex DsrMKJOP subunit DsrJ [bacterium]|nr:sulfate reduction electron transfer complex DsrMKJOP subunit DsrJ [bacterium]